MFALFPSKVEGQGTERRADWLGFKVEARTGVEPV